MAVTLTGSGGLFTRLGKLFGLAKTIRTHQRAIGPTAATATTGIREVYAAFASTAGTLPMATDLVRSISNEDLLADASLGSVAAIKQAAERTVVEMVDADKPLPEKTVDEALRELAAQMNGVATLARSTFTVGAPSYAASNVGNAVVIVSCEATKIIRDRVTFATKLTDFPCVRAETLAFYCVQDTKTAGVNSGSEVWRVTGDRSYSNLDRRWRAGSGAMFEIEQTSAAVDGFGPTAAPRNLLNNSDFGIFEANVPAQWTVATGTAGTDFGSTTTTFRGGTAFRFIGDGATLTRLRQRINSADGTYGRLKGDTLYCLSFVARDDGTAPAAGVVRVSVQDASGNVLGTNMAAAIDFATVGSAYTRVVTNVISPVDIPDEAYVVLELTTALTNARQAFVDEVTLCEMRRLAPGGPAVAILAGSLDSRRGDLATVAISASEVGEFNLELDRMFDLYGSGIVLPSAAATSATVVDSLIS